MKREKINDLFDIYTNTFASEATFAIDQIENEKMSNVMIGKKRKSTIMEIKQESFDNVYSQNILQLPINDLIECTEDDRDRAFFRKLVRMGKTNEKHSLLPDQVDVLRYIKSDIHKDPPPWYNRAHEDLLNNSYSFPPQEALCRDYIYNFLREPIDNERACNRPNCHSLVIGGFRCRELVMPNESLTRDIHGWCYICHLYETNRLYWENIGKETSETIHKNVYSIHHFIVKTDSIGEYRLDKTIQGDSNVVGIFGPFPFFNQNNYVKIRDDNGNNRLLESDSMVFRLPPKASVQIENSHIILPVGKRICAEFDRIGEL